MSRRRGAVGSVLDRCAFDIVVKVGGSLGRGPAPLRAIVRRLTALARRRRVLVVPGGGAFADLVRRERRRLGLDAEAAHRMALRAIDQYGLLLASLHPRASAAADLAAARRLAVSRRLAILLPSALVDRAPSLERTFRLTSDAIAAWVAGRTGARRLLLLKSVRGIDLSFSDREAAAGLARRGIVDPLFPRLLPTGIAVQVVDGRGAWTLSRTIDAAPPGRSGGARPRANRSVPRRRGRPGRR
ncbi:MAG TPA: aspartate/glutamate/uridylate kinase [Candidatus Polarisedimenticolia bacterium]|nr:aspartate/glutamate/uridylate kinase [Candidatus Polarisedimenticolia bacterium]